MAFRERTAGGQSRPGSAPDDGFVRRRRPPRNGLSLPECATDPKKSGQLTRAYMSAFTLSGGRQLFPINTPPKLPINVFFCAEQERLVGRSLKCQEQSMGSLSS